MTLRCPKCTSERCQASKDFFASQQESLGARA
jgi:ferrochelatase